MVYVGNLRNEGVQLDFLLYW